MASAGDTAGGSTADGAFRAAARAILFPSTGHPRHAVYGTVLAAGLIAAQDPDQDSAAEIIAAVATTMVVFWLAHGYAHAIGHRVRRDTGDGIGRVADRRAGAGAGADAGFGWSGARRALVENWPMVRASFLPLAVLAVARAAGASVSDAQEAALWTSLLLLCAWGLFSGRAGGLRRWRLAGYTAGIALLGIVLIGLEVAIH
ncbi:hypothetical protein MXD62_22895 [Frankia sp. Mgl5]|uniref:hypothetical protein n=1 Tax=Frankia sp. Mgl5 TaxID=2933793 RepID=UPI00200BC01B|nr:hypothetical protein [Frankia sp. Mgl5]MCK9929977.1 hypothetical protein [Frankia sp. Mgl5]